MMYLIQSLIVLAVVAHDHVHHWNISGNRLVPTTIGFAIAYCVTVALFYLRLAPASRSS
jgi:hypothetical protein